MFNRMTKKFRYIVVTVLMTTSSNAFAQQLTLPDAIRIAQENSYDAQLARFSFLASYWTYRSFKAELLPSVNLNGGLANFDHSLVAVRNYEDGQVAYVDCCNGGNRVIAVVPVPPGSVQLR